MTHFGSFGLPSQSLRTEHVHQELFPYFEARARERTAREERAADAGAGTEKGRELGEEEPGVTSSVAWVPPLCGEKWLQAMWGCRVRTWIWRAGRYLHGVQSIRPNLQLQVQLMPGITMLQLTHTATRLKYPPRPKRCAAENWPSRDSSCNPKKNQLRTTTW